MIIELIELMKKFGMKVNLRELSELYEYLLLMLKDGRIITFRENNDLFGFCVYSMTDDPYDNYDNKMFQYKEHDVDAKGCYFELIVSLKWDKKLRILLEDAISSRFPNFEYGVWHRPSLNDDRILIVNRRKNVPDKHIN